MNVGMEERGDIKRRREGQRGKRVREGLRERERRGEGERGGGERREIKRGRERDKVGEIGASVYAPFVYVPFCICATSIYVPFRICTFLRNFRICIPLYMRIYGSCAYMEACIY
jgi:hypothetical protein